MRDLPRTAESIDEHLANATPRPPTPAEYAEGFRDAVFFFAGMGAIVWVCLYLGGF